MVKATLLIPLLAVPVLAQPKVPDPPPLEIIVHPEARLTNKLIVVVDASASMSGHYAAAVNYAVGVASQPVDHYDVIPIIFGATAHVWPHGWVKLPSEKDSLKVMGWLTLQRQHINTSQTHLQAALNLAYKQDPKKEATIVVVTDGDTTKLDPIPDDRLVAAIQTEHVDYPTFVKWAKGCKAGMYRIKCKHEWDTDDSLDHYECHKCNGMKPKESAGSAPAPDGQ
jgi:hypothetical protein